MAIRAANEQYLCPAGLGAKVAPGNGNNNQTFTISGGGAVTGGRIIPGITWAAYSNSPGDLVDPDDGPIGDVITESETFINLQLSAGADRNALNINQDEAGQWLYSRRSGTTLWYPVATIRTDTGGNGNLMRIRGNRDGNNQAAVNLIGVNSSPGDEVLLADVGDDGMAKTFSVGGSTTTATSFVIDPDFPVTIQPGDTISSSQPYSTTTQLI